MSQYDISYSGAFMCLYIYIYLVERIKREYVPGRVTHAGSYDDVYRCIMFAFIVYYSKHVL